MQKYAAFLLISAATLAGCHHRDVIPEQATPVPVHELLKANNYTPYIPFRENWGPGYVFEAEEDEDGNLMWRTGVCRNVFGGGSTAGNMPIEPSRISIPDYQASDARELDFSISLLSGLIGEDNSAQLSLADYSSQYEVSVSWGQIKEYGYLREDLFDPETGARIVVEPACASAIQSLQDSGDFEGRVWLVTRAVAVSGMDYAFSLKDSGGAGAELDLNTVLDASAGAGWSVTSENTMEIESPVFLGYADVIPLSAWFPTGATSGRGVAVQIGTDERAGDREVRQLTIQE